MTLAPTNHKPFSAMSVLRLLFSPSSWLRSYDLLACLRLSLHHSRLRTTPWTTLASRIFEPAPSSLLALSCWCIWKKKHIPMYGSTIDGHGRTVRAFCQMRDVVEHPTFHTRGLHGSLASSQVRSHLSHSVTHNRGSLPSETTCVSRCVWSLVNLVGRPIWRSQRDFWNLTEARTANKAMQDMNCIWKFALFKFVKMSVVNNDTYFGPSISDDSLGILGTKSSWKIQYHPTGSRSAKPRSKNPRAPKCWTL